MITFYRERFELDFQYFKIKPMSSRSILGRAVRITCWGNGIVVRARFCPVPDFGGVVEAVSDEEGVGTLL